MEIVTCFVINWGKNVDRPVELEDVKYPDYLAKWETFSDYSSIPQSRRLHVYTDTQGRHVCQRLKEVIPRWRFLSPLDGELYYYQQLLLMNALECGTLTATCMHDSCAVYSMAYCVWLFNIRRPQYWATYPAPEYGYGRVMVGWCCSLGDLYRTRGKAPGYVTI